MMNTLHFFNGYILMLVVKHINSAMVTCGVHQYTVTSATNSSVRSCVDCQPCPAGMGTVPQCGAFLKGQVDVRCKKCKTGETFSPSHDFTSCEPCTICVDNQIIIRNCTSTSNTICGECKHGYYRSYVQSCERCSPCCSEAQHVEDQCLRQGLSKSNACRYTGLQCQRTQGSLQSNKPTKRDEQESKRTTIMLWPFILGGVVILALCLIIALLTVKIWCRRQCKLPVMQETTTIWQNRISAENICLASNMAVNRALDGSNRV